MPGARKRLTHDHYHCRRPAGSASEPPERRLRSASDLPASRPVRSAVAGKTPAGCGHRRDDLLMGVRMFERFLEGFQLLPPKQVTGVTWQEPRLLSADGYAALADRFAGCSFENGLYRLHDATSGPRALTWIADAFPEFASRACPFGYDWLGRQFAIDTGRQQAGQPLVLLLEPGTGEGLEIPLTFGALPRRGTRRVPGRRVGQRILRHLGTGPRLGASTRWGPLRGLSGAAVPWRSRHGRQP